MSGGVQEIAEQLRRCADALAEAVAERDLDQVEGLVRRRRDLLEALRKVDSPLEAAARETLAQVAEADSAARSGLQDARDEIVGELESVRKARRRAVSPPAEGRTSRFVSTRC